MNSPKYKIVVSGRDVIGTGGGTVLLETVKEFVALGHNVSLVVDYNIPAINGVNILVTPFGQRLKDWEPKGKVAFRLKHCLQLVLFSIFGRFAVSKLEKKGFISIDHNGEAFGGDIVVLHNVFIEQFYADRRSNFQKIPQFLNPTFTFRLLRERILLRRKSTRRIIAVSDQTYHEARRLTSISTPIFVIESGINIEKFKILDDQTRDNRRKIEKAHEKFITLFVGHEFERKRLDLVIHAMHSLPDNHELWVIGGRMSKVNDYILLATELNVQNRVRFLGTVSDAERYFEMADAFVLPSNYETWGLVSLEAMACGVPVIMTPVGCASKVIVNNENGYIVGYDSQEIAEKLNFLATNAEQHKLMKRSARLKAEQHSWSNVAKLYIDQVKSIAEIKLHG